MRNLTRRIEQTQARREELETEHGSTLEQQNEIDRLKQLERNLKTDLQNERVELKQLQKRQDKTLKETRQRVGKLKQEIYAAAKERDELELGLNRTKPLNELDERYETLKKENETDRKIVDDDNATSSDKQAATERIIEREEEMERAGPANPRKGRSFSFARTGQEHLQEVRLDPAGCCPCCWHCAKRSCPCSDQRA